MALGYISIAVFLFGCVTLILSALLLVSPVAAFCRTTWQRVALSYLTASIFALIAWNTIVWNGPIWVGGGIAFFFVLPLGSLFADIRKVAGTQNSMPTQLLCGSFGRSLALVPLSIITAVFLGRTAVEVGVTNGMPIFFRTAMQFDFTIELDGQDYPAKFVSVNEKTFHVWTPRHEAWPNAVPFAPGLRNDFPKVITKLPFEIYMTSFPELFSAQEFYGSRPLSHAFSNIAVVHCPTASTSCFRTSPQVKESADAAFGDQLSGKGTNTLYFKAMIPENENAEPREYLFSFKNIQTKYLSAGPFTDVPENGSLWLLTAWDWFPADHKRKCNNTGFLSEWRLCNISNETREVIRQNQAKLEQADQKPLD